MTALAARTAAERTAYDALLNRLAVDLAELRLRSSNLESVGRELRAVELHVAAERSAVARLADRVVRQESRLKELRRQ